MKKLKAINAIHVIPSVTNQPEEPWREGSFVIEPLETFPQLVRKYRPTFQGWYVESAEGALTGYSVESKPRRVIDLVEEMSKLTPA